MFHHPLCITVCDCARQKSYRIEHYRGMHQVVKEGKRNLQKTISSYIGGAQTEVKGHFHRIIWNNLLQKHLRTNDGKLMWAYHRWLKKGGTLGIPMWHKFATFIWGWNLNSLMKEAEFVRYLWRISMLQSPAVTFNQDWPWYVKRILSETYGMD